MQLISRKKATIQNIIVTLVYQLLTMIIGFLVPQMFLTTYGPSIHGLTSSITNIMSYVMLLYAGLNAASVQTLYAPVSKNDTKRINEVFNAIKKYYINTGIVFAIVVFIISIILPRFIQGISGSTVFLMMIVMGSQSTINSFLISSNRVLLQADQKLYISNLFNIITMIFRGLLQILLIFYSTSPIIVQSVPAAVLIIPIILQRVYIKKNYPYLNAAVKPDKSALSKRWSALVHQVSGLIVNSTDTLLLTVITGNMILVSIYSVYQLIFSHLYSLLNNIFSQGTVASFGQLIVADKIESLRKNYSFYEFVYYGVVTIIYSTTSVMMMSFVKLYTSGASEIEYADYTLTILFVIIGVANNLKVPGVTLINAGGLYKETQGRAMLEALINLVASLILIKPLGLYGLLIGTMLSFVYRTLDTIIFTNKNILKTSSKLTFMRMFKVILLIITITLLGGTLIDESLTSWGQWFSTATVVFLLSSVFTFMINIITEYHLTLELIIQLMNIFKRKNK